MKNHSLNTNEKQRHSKVRIQLPNEYTIRYHLLGRENVLKCSGTESLLQAIKEDNCSVKEIAEIRVFDQHYNAYIKLKDMC